MIYIPLSVSFVLQRELFFVLSSWAHTHTNAKRVNVKQFIFFSCMNCLVQVHSCTNLNGKQFFFLNRNPFSDSIWKRKKKKRTVSLTLLRLWFIDQIKWFYLLFQHFLHTKKKCRNDHCRQWDVEISFIQFQRRPSSIKHIQYYRQSLPSSSEIDLRYKRKWERERERENWEFF